MCQSWDKSRVTRNLEVSVLFLQYIDTYTDCDRKFGFDHQREHALLLAGTSKAQRDPRS